MSKGFGVSNSGSKKKKSNSGKFFSELPAVKELFVVINLPTNLEIIPLEIEISFDEIALYSMVKIKPHFIDVKPFYPQVQFLSKFVETNSISWSDFISDAGKFDDQFKTLLLAKYLTINTKKSHAVMKIGEINKINTAKYLPAISLTYDESYRILEEEILDKFGKMPTFDEYFKSHIEDISTELKESL
ncbi:MAG: hypothetical protein F6K22_37330 [Okeania sp. SIO2F4]|uniref:hypothetical protein n=1 Tax=Okeania sp. SIO2F4 TaxID=2607790 RepID=UPI00142C1AB9|nr:hypothetical protein [Okeania sp. SIO2F4]NES07957.1 hypothetical protein [Okeania sp. SIO2F4]